jgi:Xaa-Pro aminopeptidase
MANEELRKACRSLRGAGFDAALLTSREDVVYVSGFDEPVPIGSPPDVAGGLPLALAVLDGREERGVLIVTEGYGEQAARQNRLAGTLRYSTFSMVSPVDASRNLFDVVREALRGVGLAGSSRARLGVAFETLPSVLLRALALEYPNVSVAGCRRELDEARLVKTPREIGLLREAARVADAGQAELVRLAREFRGIGEFEAWAAVGARVMEAADRPVPVPMIGELVTGPRTNVVRYPGGPRARRIEAGDTGIMDLSVRVDGYWADCCNTVVFGCEPTAEQKRYHAIAREGFQAAVARVRPGTRCADIQAAVWDVFKANGFRDEPWVGHSIGATVNERPRPVSYDTTPLEPGMVFCLEPGVYAGSGGTTGARLERMVLVTDTGSEILNAFPGGLE